MDIKVEIFSGFLGAGKTQLIKKLIQEGYYKDRIAIIENEFGEVSIDGEVLRRTNTIVKEINSGCICCQVTGDFKESLLDIIQNCEVDRLIIEPTGVAKLSDLKKTLLEKEFEGLLTIDKSITIVDSEKFNVYLSNFRNFFVDQIKNADLIVLSRTQKIQQDELIEVEKSIKKLNSSVDLITKSWEKASAKELIPEKIQYSTNVANKDLIRKLSVKNATLNKEAERANETFETFALAVNKQFSKEELISKFNFIGSNSTYGNVVRAKGIVNTKKGKMEQFNYTLSEINMEEIRYKGDGVISFIGTNLNKEEIIKFFL